MEGKDWLLWQHWGWEALGSPQAWSWLHAPGQWACSRTGRATAAGSAACIASDTAPVAAERIGMGRDQWVKHSVCITNKILVVPQLAVVIPNKAEQQDPVNRYQWEIHNVTWKMTN